MLPLAGLLVVSVGESVAVRFASRILAAGGAQVIRFATEAEGDDAIRTRAEAYAYDASVDVVPVATAGALIDVLPRALRTADVLLEDDDSPLVRSALERSGGAAPLPSSQVRIHLSGYGTFGPLAGVPTSELTMQAAGGFLTLSGHPDREPVRVALDQMHLTSGRVAAFAALLGLFGGERPGGWEFDVSIAEVAASLPPFHVPGYTHTGAIAGRGPSNEPPLDGEHVPTRDGYISFATGNTRPEMFAALLEAESLVDERFLTPMGRALHQAELTEIVEQASRDRSKFDLFNRAIELGIVAGIVQDLDDLLGCEHLRERGALERIVGDDLLLPRLGLAVDGFDLVPPRPPRTIAVNAAVESIERHPRQTRTPHGTPDSPLSGIVVSSFEDFLAAPWGTLQLARFGARVYRVESPTRIQARHWGVYPDNQPGPEYWNQGGYLAQIYRGKRSLAIDLDSGAARDAVRPLLEHSDLVVESFRPGVLDRMGLGPDAIHQVAPETIFLRSTGYGQSGPYASMGAFARTIDAMSGLTYLTGYSDGPPVRANPSYMDMTAGWSNALGAMLGLIARDRGAESVTIDHAMYESGVSTVATALISRQLGATPQRGGNDDDASFAEGVFETLDGRYLAISLRTLEDWTAFARVLRQYGADLEDVPPEQRSTRLEEVAASVRCVAGDELERALLAAGVPARLALDTREVVVDAHLNARRFYEWVATPLETHEYVRPYPGTPIALMPDGRHPSVTRPPMMGEHNHEALEEVAGVEPALINHLEASGALSTRPRDGIAEPPRPMDLEAALRRGALTGVDADFDGAIARMHEEAFR